MFSWEFCKIRQNTFFAEHHQIPASDYSSINSISNEDRIGQQNCKLWYKNYKKYNQKLHHVEYYDEKWKHFNPFLEIMFTAFEHDLKKGIELLAKLVFSFSIIVFNMMKLLVILFIMKLIAQINIFKYDTKTMH